MGLPFSPPRGSVGPDELSEIARCVAEHPRLWEDDLDPDRSTRTYNEVFTSEHLGVWAICWNADDHDTGYHDHGSSCGAPGCRRAARTRRRPRCPDPV